MFLLALYPYISYTISVLYFLSLVHVAAMKMSLQSSECVFNETSPNPGMKTVEILREAYSRKMQSSSNG